MNKFPPAQPQRVQVFAPLLCAYLLFSLTATACAASPSDGIDRSVMVPLDYSAPTHGRAALAYEFGAPYAKSKPTVFIIADAQQFYVRRRAVADLQKSLFGDAFNVVGIINRGTTQMFIKAALDARGQPDWVKAWHIFNSENDIRDIETVRRAIVGSQGKILLYGQSGGAFLAHQYLAEYGEHVLRAYTPGALNPFIEGELGLDSDHFWQEIGAEDPTLQPMLKTVLRQHPSDRATLVMTLQRQNFFVPPDKIGAARASLIRALAAGDAAAYRQAQAQYQVPQVSAFFNSPAGIPVRVRLFEFFAPSGAARRLGGDAVHPDLENQADFAAPLMRLYQAGTIPELKFDWLKIHRLATEVLVLAGRQDHTVDYRSSIALAASYPRHVLLIVNDGHEFTAMKADGSYPRLGQAFLKSGMDSAAFKAAFKATAPHRWTEP